MKCSVGGLYQQRKEVILVDGLILLNGSNWQDFFNKKITYVMFSKSDCEQCKILETHIASTYLEKPFPLAKLTLDRPGFAGLKQKFPWISRIDTLPFNTIFSGGKLVDSWSGSSFEVLKNKLIEFSN